MPYTIQALIGSKGVVAFFVLLFMALTSTVSSSMIAVGSILSFDIYKTYINPQASDRKLIRASHLAVVFHGIFITAFSIALNYGGANMTWIGYFRPILTGPGILPLIFSLTWRRQTRLAAILAPILGLATGVGVWLGTAKSIYGEINLLTTEEQAPSLYGSMAAFFSPGLYSILISLYKPEKFDWREFLRVELMEKPSQDEYNTASTKATEQTEVVSSDKGDIPEKTVAISPSSNNTSTTPSPAQSTISLDDLRHPFEGSVLQELCRWYRLAWIMWIALVLLTFVLWPMPLYRDYVFTKSFFSGWTTVAIIWQFFAFGAVVVFPLYDGKYEIAKGARGVHKSVWEYFGKK